MIIDSKIVHLLSIVFLIRNKGGMTMSLIKIRNLTFSYYGYTEDIFKGISLSLDTNWKTGLIGRNGIGKSTLFKLLSGELEYTGEIFKDVECIRFPPRIEEDGETIDIWRAYGDDLEEWRLLKELSLLKVDEDILYRPFSTLSEGERTKFLLAMMFTKEGGFLLIDEPTNHLDLHGRELVSRYLKGKDGFLLISHDRDFLDSCIDHVISINRASIDIQAGNFTTWYENRQRKEQFETKENEKLKKDIKRLKEAAKQTEVWSDKIEKSKKGSKVSGSKPDRGYIGHQAARMMKKSKNLERRQDKAIEDKEKLLRDVERKEDLKLHCLPYRKKELMRVEELSCFYNGKKVVSDIGFEVNEGDRIAIKGGNGSGKSTLLKLILGEEIEHGGRVQLPDDLKLSYISQSAFHLRGSLRDFIMAEEVDETLCKTILRKLDFSRELFDVKLENYSDGQKKKVLIAVSLSKEAHIFVWDEPLNYIDVISRIQIEDILLKQRPTLLFVEHDRRFMEKIATKRVDLDRY